MTLNRMNTKLVYDIGIKLSDNDDAWNKANEFLETVAKRFGLEVVSAGTGFGIRDMQLEQTDEGPDLTEQIKQIINDAGLIYDYVSRTVTRIITIQFEVHEGVTPEQYREWLCAAIHERDVQAQQSLQDCTNDISEPLQMDGPTEAVIN